MFYKGREVKALGRHNSDLHGFGDKVRNELSTRIPRDRDVRVLDVGTGFATTAEFLARTLSKESRIWTLDPSPTVLKKARAAMKAKGLDSRVEFIRGSMDRVDLPDEFFDFLVSVMTLHHMKELHTPIGEMARVLGNRGRVLLVDYSPEAAHELEFRVEHREKDFFQASDVAATLNEEGFRTKTSDFGLWYLVEGTRLHSVRQRNLLEPKGHVNLAMDKVNLVEKFELVSEYWHPKIVCEFNDSYAKVTKLKGEFQWHKHEREDEMFLVVKGKLLIKLRDRDIRLGEGELFVVPKGAEHKPIARDEVHLILFEPKTTVNTGSVRNEMTVADEWI
jgi:SAM-dependent methyltransferase